MKTGGSTEERRKEVQVRQDLIKQYLMKTPNTQIKYVDLSALFDVNADTIRRNCTDMAETDKTIHLSRGAVFYVPPTRYSDNRTEEGYSDPTAFAAINNVEKPIKEISSYEVIKMPKAGDVWDVKCATGNVEKYIVIAVNEDDEYATCIQYFAKDSEMESSCKKLYSKPIKYFRSRTWGTPLSQLTKYKNMIRDYLDIDAEEKVVEKIVEKVVEVPVEKVVEKVVEIPECNIGEPVTSGKLYTQEELDMEIIKMRAEIYKECMYLMAGRKEMFCNE